MEDSLGLPYIVLHNQQSGSLSHMLPLAAGSPAFGSTVCSCKSLGRALAFPADTLASLWPGASVV